MRYDFDSIIPRRGSLSMKWDSYDDILPMWVADMDFKTAPCILEALKRRVRHGIFGYTHIPKAYYDATVNWFERRHGWKADPDKMIYTSGVVPAISATIKALTAPAGKSGKRLPEKVIVMTPAFNCFFSSIRNNGCELAANPLIENDSGYSIDYSSLEELCSDPKARILLLCNPHNPGGRVWTREELEKVGEICLRHDVTVLSDEIHCEITFDGHSYTPFASISEEFQKHSVTFISPSKAFNIAGLQIANIVCHDDDLRSKIDRAINDNEVCDVNPFGVLATIAAYNEGESWLDALLDYLWENYRTSLDYLAHNLPEVKVMPLEGTYLLWIDCRSFGRSSDEITGWLLDKEKLAVSSGSIFGQGGDGFIRLNIATPRAILNDGLERLCRGLKGLEN